MEKGVLIELGTRGYRISFVLCPKRCPLRFSVLTLIRLTATVIVDIFCSS